MSFSKKNLSHVFWQFSQYFPICKHLEVFLSSVLQSIFFPCSDITKLFFSSPNSPSHAKCFLLPAPVLVSLVLLLQPGSLVTPLFLFFPAYLGLGSSLLAQTLSVLPTSSSCPSPYLLKPTSLQKKAPELFHIARWSPSPQKCSSPGWMGAWAIDLMTGLAAPCRGVGTKWYLRSFSTQNILWFLKMAQWFELSYFDWSLLYPHLPPQLIPLPQENLAQIKLGKL